MSDETSQRMIDLEAAHKAQAQALVDDDKKIKKHVVKLQHQFAEAQVRRPSQPLCCIKCMSARSRIRYCCVPWTLLLCSL